MLRMPKSRVLNHYTNAQYRLCAQGFKHSLLVDIAYVYKFASLLATLLELHESHILLNYILNNDCAQSLTLRAAIKRGFQIDPSHYYYRPFTTVKVQKSESCSTFQPCSSYNGPNFSPPFSLKES